ncbi:ricin-type beta-trefoil lectin domain protein [Streptomyces sp. NBC_00439]|uniref:RICIN domain-containing protein n=1 Tax=Streptomyces sp. NBC_00439 TaxID=2903650 RepID=UPI00225BCC3A|nr:ricin-type beta-trefoil lectin domain protein [Streptomyces sp. NBC_00439]MCX5106732.1 RICIN domain-containing protein [Streptomyces sp. NBC_00439]MCX5106737.1 RICIN domain-containing protein [Streptomyces sp. NBC_00439]
MADQQLDVFGGEDEDGRLWEALSGFKKEVRNLVEMTGLSTNVLADRYGFGKGKVATWQNPKPEQPNIPPLRFVEVLIKEAQERENLQDGAAAVFLRQYGELLQLYCARAKPHNVHRQMLADYQNTLLIRRLNNATNAALEQIAELTEELETLRGDRDEERRRRMTLEQQIDSLKSQNQSRAVEKHAAVVQRDEIRAGLAQYESNPPPVVPEPSVEQGGPHTHHHEPAVPLPPPLGRGTKRRRHAVSLIAVGVVVVSLAVYAGTQLPGDRNDHKGTADGKPDQTSTHKPSTDGSASPGRSPRTSVTATPHQTAGGGSTGGGSSNGGSSSNGSSSNGGGAGTDPTKGAAGGSGDAGGSHGSNGSSGASNPATPPASSDRFRLRDVGYGKCLAVSYSVVFYTCADTPATNWTAKAGSDGSYMLYNESADQCLHVNRNQLSMADCGSSRQNWRTGTSSTVVNLDSSLCLEERSGWPVMGSCEPSKSTQHWAKE